MRTIIFFVLASFFTINAKSQSLDSLKQRILKLETEVSTIDHNLTQSHKQFQRGYVALILGTLANVAYIHSVKVDNKREILLYVEIPVSLYGSILMVDSHKYIGRSRRRK